VPAIDPAAARTREASALTLDRVAKRFGAVEALAGVSLDVAAGELLTVLGPSGSGKSTLLHTIAGYELPDAGAIVLGGRDITGVSPAKRDIGMVFQNYALFPHMSVADNVAFPLVVRHLPRDEIRACVEQALGLVALGGLGQRQPRELSGGQQQRVALARAIVFAPRLLLLDEPLGALDRKLRDAMQLEIKRLQRQLRITTLFITHDQEEALALSDRVAVLHQGKLEQVGTPAEIYAHPANRFIADFVGESNLLAGTIVELSGGEAVLECGTLRLVAAADGMRAGARATLMIRPEVPQVVAAGPRPRNVVAATVTERIGVGAAERYRLAAGGMELRLNVPAHPARRGFAPGDTIEIGWEPGDGHLLAG
jgi:putative spermidine/putrescine transport system ATP-binding protein